MGIGIVSLYVQVSHFRGKPCIELRKKFTDPELVKQIVSCAWHDTGLTVLPVFNDKVAALGSLVEKGIVYKDDKGKYQFTL